MSILSRDHLSLPVATMMAGLIFLGSGLLGSQARADFRGDLLINDNVSSQILAFNPTTGAYLGIFATVPGSGPSYMVEGPNGNIYVGTYFSGSALEFDGSTGAQINGFKLQPPTPNAIITGLAFDSQGNLYAANAKATNNGTIDKYNATTGAFVQQIAAGLATPRGLVVDNGNLYITTAGTAVVGSIVEFSLTGQLLNTFATNLPAGRPEGLVVGPNGNLFTTDGVSSVYQFTTAGVQVGAGPYVTNSGILATYGAGFGPDGSLFVTSDTGPTFKFNASGNLIGTGAFIAQSGAGYSFPYPVQPLFNAVPEPSSIILLLTGASVIAIGKYRNRRNAQH